MKSPILVGVEGAQYGDMTLENFLRFCVSIGCKVAQPSANTVDLVRAAKDDGYVREVLDLCRQEGITLISVSTHVVLLPHGSNWDPGMASFIPKDLYGKPDEIKAYAERTFIASLHGLAKLGCKYTASFWGNYFGPGMDPTCPFPMFNDPINGDRIKAGWDRFMSETEKIRETAKKLGIAIAHEPHKNMMFTPNSEMILNAERELGIEILVNYDPSQFSCGEPWDKALVALAPNIRGIHAKNMIIDPNRAREHWTSDWTQRSPRFCTLNHPNGEVSFRRMAELLVSTGLINLNNMPDGADPGLGVLVEAEDPFEPIEKVSENGVAHVLETMCFDLSEGSFETGMVRKD